MRPKSPKQDFRRNRFAVVRGKPNHLYVFSGPSGFDAFASPRLRNPGNSPAPGSLPRRRGLEFIQSFDAGQRRAATISDAPPREIITTAQVDNLEIGTDGLAFDRPSKDQQDRLVQLAALYTGRLRPGHAEVRLDEVKRHLHETVVGAVVFAATIHAMITF